jgi:hypothetical protein
MILTNFFDGVTVSLTDAEIAGRQALRDVTAQAGFPHSVVWPTKPD